MLFFMHISLCSIKSMCYYLLGIKKQMSANSFHVPNAEGFLGIYNLMKIITNKLMVIDDVMRAQNSVLITGKFHKLEKTLQYNEFTSSNPVNVTMIFCSTEH